jgi:hypothetical protein
MQVEYWNIIGKLNEFNIVLLTYHTKPYKKSEVHFSVKPPQINPQDFSNLSSKREEKIIQGVFYMLQPVRLILQT